MCVNRLTGEVRTKVMFKSGANKLNGCASVERGFARIPGCGGVSNRRHSKVILAANARQGITGSLEY